MNAGLFAAPQTAPALSLRPYQDKALGAIVEARERGVQRGLVVMPTGTGKTVLFASLIDMLDVPSLVLAHRDELLRQAQAEIRGICPRLAVGIECGPEQVQSWENCAVASVQTIGRPGSTRLAWLNPGLMIVDEAHHAPADSYQRVLERFGSYEGRCFTMGLTATDHRLDNKPLHGHSERAIFEEVIFRYSLREAIADGWLVQIRGFRVESNVDMSKVKTVGGDYVQGQLAKAVNTPERNASAIRHWQQVAGDRRTIVFCADVQHSKDVAESFRAHGIAAESVDGTMDKQERGAIIERFRTGKTQVLSNVEIATEGFNVKEIGCVLMLRPTLSWSLYTQMAGRGTRILGSSIEESRKLGKSDVIILDVVDNSGRHNLATTPSLLGLPANFDLQGRSLEDAAKKLDELGAMAAGLGIARPGTFEELDTIMREVDLFASIKTPDDVARASSFNWLAVGEGGLILECGSFDDEKRRLARLAQDVLGRYWLKLSSSVAEYKALPLSDDRVEAVKTADRLIRNTWRGVSSVASSDANWRGLPPSPKQMQLLRRLGFDPDQIDNLTRGRASMLISQKQAIRRAQ